MNNFNKTVILFFSIVICHSASAMTVTSLTGVNNGLGIGVQVRDTSLGGASGAGAPSTFLFTDLPLFTGTGKGPGDGTNIWRFGDFSFTQRFSLGRNPVIQSASLEISSGGHGLDALSSVFLDGAFLGHLTDADGVGPRLPGNLPSPAYNAAFKDTFDLSPFLSRLLDGVVNIRIAPGGGKFDGWVLDYARLTINLAEDNGGNTGGGTGGGTNPVPLPAAFWLLASGLITLIRRKRI